jgi:hypothetical protein
MNARVSTALVVMIMGIFVGSSWGQGFYTPRRLPYGGDLPLEVRPYFFPPGPAGQRALRESYNTRTRYSARQGEPIVFSTPRTQANSGGFVPDHGRVSRKQIIEAGGNSVNRYRAATSISSMRTESNIRRYSNR